MSDRKAISKTIRFEVFKRDEFTCQYCGGRPPAVVLEVDHIVAHSAGGSDEEHNLLTACFDCNRGKAARPLDIAISPVDVEVRAALIRERAEQVQAYEALLREERARADEAIDRVIAVYEAAFEGWTLKDRIRPSIRQFLSKLPETVVVGAMEMACERVKADRVFKYFCGICWNKIKEPQA